MINQLASSLQYVPVIVTAMGGDPTGDNVAMAFTASGVEPQTGDWKTASWGATPTPGNHQYLAQCLVGPGGTVQLAAATYQIWIKVTDNPEIPTLSAGFLTIY